MKKITLFLNDETGATAIEYGLIAGIMAVAIIASWPTLSVALTTQFTAIETAMTTVNTN